MDAHETEARAALKTNAARLSAAFSSLVTDTQDRRAIHSIVETFPLFLRAVDALEYDAYRWLSDELRNHPTKENE